MSNDNCSWPGFRIFKNVFSPQECDSIAGVLSKSTNGNTRAGARHLMSIVEIRNVAFDSRLVELSSEILGERTKPFRATLFAKTDSANWSSVWHQDTAVPLQQRFENPNWGPWSKKLGVWYAHAPQWVLARMIALRIHLDASTEENGPLRVLPNSHTRLLSDDEVSTIAKQERSLDCLVPKGGVLAMSPLIIHSSPKMTNTMPRKVLHIEYVNVLKLDEIEIAVT